MSKPLSFDDDDFAPSPQKRKGPSTALWVVLGCGIVALVLIAVIAMYSTRRMAQMRFMDARVAESEAREAEARAVREMKPPVRKNMEDVHQERLMDEMRRMMPKMLGGSS